jgi:hypothetical protein
MSDREPERMQLRGPSFSLVRQKAAFPPEPMAAHESRRRSSTIARRSGSPRTRSRGYGYDAVLWSGFRSEVNQGAGIDARGKADRRRRLHE